jgi:predicted nucleotidyltransferase component of viral defense system
MPDFHRRVLAAARAACHTHGLVLAGGYAMRAHGLVDRPSRDLDFATFTVTALKEITTQLADVYRAAGFDVEVTRGTPLLGRLVVTDPVTGQWCAVDLMKMPLQRPPTVLDTLPVASLDDMVGMKVAALHGRSVPRDLIDVFSVTDLYGYPELERLGALFDEELRLEQLLSQLDAGMAFDDDAFDEYGLDRDEVRRLRRFLLDWSNDLGMRLAEEEHLRAGQ